MKNWNRQWTALQKELSECRQAKAALGEQLKLFSRSEKIAHVGSYRRDLNTREIYWSDERFRLLGHQPGEAPLSFDLALKRVHPDDRDRFERANKDLLTDRKEYDIEYRVIRKDNGEIRHLRSLSKLETDPDSGHTIRYGVLQDITEQKEAERALRESEERFRTVFYTGPDAININRASDGFYFDINKGFSELSGYTREEVIGKKAFEINIWNNAEDRAGFMEKSQKRWGCEEP